MLYLGLRSSPAYLATLAEIRERAADAHLLSVIGGFAFLHALSPGARSLTLADGDPEALAHWGLARTLLLAADSLGDFVSLLTGWESSGDASRPERFLVRPVDHSRRLGDLLAPEARALYSRSYGGLAIEPERALGRLGGATVKLLGFDLSPDTFCWGFGTGALRDAASFAGLQALLRRLPQHTVHARFEDLDYGRLPLGPGERTIFLASNCESPLFTRGDAILHRVLATAHGELRYVSWHRDLRVGDLARPAPMAESVLARQPPFAAQVLRLAGDGPLPGPLAGVHAARTHHSLAEVVALTEYGAPLLVIDGGRPRPVLRLVARLAPSFKRVVWLPQRRCPAWRLPARLRASYDTAESAASRLWSFSLRGLRAGELPPA